MFPVAWFFFPIAHSKARFCVLSTQVIFAPNFGFQVFAHIPSPPVGLSSFNWSIWWLKSLSSPVLWETLHVTPLHKLRGDKYGMTFNSYLVLWFSFPLSLHHTTIQVTGESFFLTPKFVTNYSSWRTHAPPDIVDLLGSYFRLSQILVIFMQAQTIMPLFLFASLDPWPRALLILIPKTPLNTHV